MATANGQTVSARLDSIQQAILSCLDISADVMEILSSLGAVQEGDLEEKCRAFLQHIKSSQDHVAELVEQCQGTVDVETTVYCQMVQASIADEKCGHMVKMLERALATLNPAEGGAEPPAAPPP